MHFVPNFPVQQAGLIISSTGTVCCHLNSISSILVEGKVIGNISNVDSVVIRSTGAVHGNISCHSIQVEPNATIVGRVHISPFDELPCVDGAGNIFDPQTEATDRDDQSKVWLLMVMMVML